MKQRIGRMLLRLMGWRSESVIPQDLKKFVLIAAPHTSNMDFFLALPTLWAWDIKGHYLIKKEHFWWPFSWFLKKTGGIPVDRSKNNIEFVEDLKRLLQDADRMSLLFTPEGTRSYSKKWKTGFYRVAHSLNLPIVLAYADYKKKLVHVGEVLIPSGNLNADLEKLEEYYSHVAACFPEKFNNQFFVREA